MASFGHYQTVHLIHNIGFTALYSGHTAGSTEELFAIKAFQPSELLLEEQRAKVETNLFLNSAKVQQKVAASDAQHWAPVHEFGQIANGAFYVTDKYNRSLQQLISGHVQLDTQLLRTIIESVAKGLLELKQICNRPHGNLKASNVLIADADNILQTKTVLTDPLPDQNIDNEVHWNTDLRDIAEFIYQLVMHRQSPATRGWQAPDSPEWARLGKHANDWRNLCNQLMNAYITPDAMNIEILLEQLDKLKETRRHPLTLGLIIAGVILLATATTLFFVLKAGPPPEQTDWFKLCDDYNDWVDAVSGDLGRKRNNARAIAWQKHPELTTIVKNIKQAAYPYEIMKLQGFERISLVRKHPEYAQMKETKEALKAIEDIKDFFDPNSKTTWALLTKFDDIAILTKKHNWKGPAEYLGDMTRQLKPDSQNHQQEIAQHVDKMLDLKDLIENITTHLEEITKTQKIIAETRDPIFLRFDDSFLKQQTKLDPDLTGEKSLNQLLKKLATVADQSNILSQFIKDNWENVNINYLFEEPVRDQEKNITSETFANRIKLVEQYYHLRPDPREKLYKYVKAIDPNIALALQDDPKEGEKLEKKFILHKQNITKLELIPAIEKNRDIIESEIKKSRTAFEEINNNALLLMVDAIKWWEEKKTTTIANSEAINNQWQKRRDALLANHKKTDFENKKNRNIFQPLRKKIELTLKRLKYLSQLLPQGFGEELTLTEWNKQLTNLYGVKREGLFDKIILTMRPPGEVIDPNSSQFNNQWGKNIDDLNRWKNELAQLIPAFNKIEKALDACYLLNEQLSDETSQSNTIGELYNSWESREIFKELASALKGVTSRVENLIKIDNAPANKKYLADTALDLNSKAESRYAAWAKLANLSGDKWPNKAQDWDDEKIIQSRLKTDFATIRNTNQTRGNALRKILEDTSLEREKVFRKANIARFTKLVTNNSRNDKILNSFGNFQPYGSNADLNQIKEHEALANDLAQFTANRQWQQKDSEIEMKLFQTQSQLYRKNTADLTSQDFHQWLGIEKGVKRYIKIEPDPRLIYKQNPNNIDAKARDIEQLINNKVIPTKPDKAKEFLTLFNAIDAKAENIFKIHAIEGNREIIREQVSSLALLWQQFQELEKSVKSVIKPEYCKYVELLENGQLIFDPEATTLRSFEPVTRKNNGTFDLFGIGKWEDFKESATLRETFFERTQDNNKLNIGWPKYIRSKKDQSIILRFIPAGPGNTKPFYIATHEITNKQYISFMNKTKAETAKYTGLVMFSNSMGSLIRTITSSHPPCRIKWKQSEKIFVVSNAYEEVPVTYVTFTGAKAYAQWLESQLPKTEQHEYASRARTKTAYPWGDDRSEISKFAHIRASAWIEAAKQYNTKITNPLEITHEPLGAIKESLSNKMINIDNVINQGTNYKSPWPTASNSQPNNWGIHDMIGNVWEWCKDDANNEQSLICGGSSLSPPEYAKPDSKHKFKSTANDVGFRVIVPAK